MEKHKNVNVQEMKDIENVKTAGLQIRVRN